MHQFTALTASMHGAADSGFELSTAEALDHDYVISRLYELHPPCHAYMPWRDFPKMLRGTIRLELGHGLATPCKPSVAEVGQHHR